MATPEDTAREIASNGIDEVTVAGRKTKFIDPEKALNVQDRMDRKAALKRRGVPHTVTPSFQCGVQD